ncbi:MAG: Mth938-like domain-containing protein [Rhodobiaceae bacterium]|nr:Mth938-like domain-containing protein [Rhodobiaceae bacterium]
MDFSTPTYARQPAIDAYGDGGFRLGGQRYVGSLVLCPESDPVLWGPIDIASVGLGDLTGLIKAKDNFDVLLIGSGVGLLRPSAFVRDALKEQSINWDVMDTGAAARTYNVLLSEGRRVAAALIAVD